MLLAEFICFGIRKFSFAFYLLPSLVKNDSPDLPSPSEILHPGEKVLGTEMDTIISAAWLYYHENLTQAEIAQRLNLSRPAVINLLANARETGIVTISIRSDLLSQLSIAERMREKFGLASAYIVPTPENADSAALKQSLGKAGALLLEKMLQPGNVLATTWGSTIMAVAMELSGKKVKDLILAQSVGSLSSGESFSPIRLASILAEKLGANAYHLPVPAIVSSIEVRDILLGDHSVRSCLSMAKAAAVALLGIGKVSYDATVVKADFVSRMMIDELKAKGAVGDISCRFFDIQGRQVKTEFEDRVISLTLDEISDIRSVIAIAGGDDKVEAILGGLRTGCVNILVTDERTAQKVLALDQQIPKV